MHESHKSIKLLTVENILFHFILNFNQFFLKVIASSDSGRLSLPIVCISEYYTVFERKGQSMSGHSLKVFISSVRMDILKQIF